MASDSTRWSLVVGAAAGDPAAREAFARRYEPVVRAFLGARWKGTPLLAEVDDATQEVFVECFKENGALERVAPQPARFRTFLYAVVRNVGLRIEERRRRPAPEPLGEVPARDDSPSRAFDRAWARAVLRRAAALQAERAADEHARRRVEILRLRFAEGLPIRDIARLWGEEPARIHHEYASARADFRRALRDVVAGDGGDEAQVEAECAWILEVLGP